MTELECKISKAELIDQLRQMVTTDDYRATAAVIFEEENSKLVIHGASNLSVEAAMVFHAIQVLSRRYNEIAAVMASVPPVAEGN